MDHDHVKLNIYRSFASAGRSSSQAKNHSSRTNWAKKMRHALGEMWIQEKHFKDNYVNFKVKFNMNM